MEETTTELVIDTSLIAESMPWQEYIKYYNDNIFEPLRRLHNRRQRHTNKVSDIKLEVGFAGTDGCRQVFLIRSGMGVIYKGTFVENDPTNSNDHIQHVVNKMIVKIMKVGINKSMKFVDDLPEDLI